MGIIRPSDLSEEEVLLLKYATKARKDSLCIRLGVGAASLNSDGSIGFGSNGAGCKAWAGDYNCPKGGQPIGSNVPCHGEHAEKVLLASLHSKPVTVLVTTFPCSACARALIEAGVRRVIYINDYGENVSWRSLCEAGVEVLKLVPERQDSLR